MTTNNKQQKILKGGTLRGLRSWVLSTVPETRHAAVRCNYFSVISNWEIFDVLVYWPAGRCYSTRHKNGARRSASLSWKFSGLEIIGWESAYVQYFLRLVDVRVPAECRHTIFVWNVYRGMANTRKMIRHSYRRNVNYFQLTSLLFTKTFYIRLVTCMSVTGLKFNHPLFIKQHWPLKILVFSPRHLF